MYDIFHIFGVKSKTKMKEEYLQDITQNTPTGPLMCKGTYTKTFNKHMKSLRDKLQPKAMDNIVFRQIVETYARVCTDEEAVDKYIQENGYTYNDGVSGVIKKSHEAVLQSDIRRLKLQYMKEIFKFKFDGAGESKLKSLID